MSNFISDFTDKLRTYQSTTEVLIYRIYIFIDRIFVIVVNVTENVFYASNIQLCCFLAENIIY